MEKTIGAQFYTIRDFCQDLSGFDESCRKVSEIGYKKVQLSRIGDFEAKDVKRILDKYNLECVCTHRPAKHFEENLEELIQWHKEIGCSIAGLASFSGDWKDVKSFTDKYNKIADILCKNGITFAYHNHHFEFTRYGEKSVFELICENTAPEKFKFILDLYWIAYAGFNPVKMIEKYKDRAVCVHFKDMGIFEREIKMFEVGRGNIDWDDIIAACEQTGVKYAIVEQDICDKDPFESLKMSYDYLKQKGFY